MQEKLKVVTIGDYNISILKNYFKDNENIEFLILSRLILTLPFFYNYSLVLYLNAPHAA